MTHFIFKSYDAFHETSDWGSYDSFNNNEKLDAINFFKQDAEQKIEEIKTRLEAVLESKEYLEELERLEIKVKKTDAKKPEKLEEIVKTIYAEFIDEEQTNTEETIQDLESLEVMDLLTEAKYRWVPP